ncbi:MAG TPA: hypothetical protein VG015_02470 [Candidatus Dormibacteraeota bacterium]|jgi:hypothetical protein|nr:hypothetical protein [Candidatus Dormibacteraeota bacterium]
MKVRTASLRDLGRVEQLYHAGSRITQVEPPVRLWSLFSRTLSALLPLTGESLLFVCEDRGRVAGFIQASSQSAAGPGSSRLQVLNLCLGASHDVRVAGALVDHLCNQCLDRGVLRLFVRLPLDDPLLPVFRQSGFRQYATELILYADAPVQNEAPPPPGLRPVRGRDDRMVYHLYRKVTPMGVAGVEAPSYPHWRALKRDWARPPQTRGQEVELVVDRVELVSWARVRVSEGAQPHTLSFMTLPEDGMAGEIADAALGRLGSECGPTWSSLRHYDSLMIGALLARNFEILVHQALLVRELAIRAPVREKGLVPSFG